MPKFTHWVDTHCHLDAPEFDSDRAAAIQSACNAGVALCVIPAVSAQTWSEAIRVAHQHQCAYALGIHPLYTPQASPEDVERLSEKLNQHLDDPRLVAIGEIGLDYFVPLDNERQEQIYKQQLLIAKQHQLPVILHVRRSVDKVLKYLRETGFASGGIAHAFNGSAQQAQQFLDMGFKLGFGGAVTFERALQLRRLAQTLPATAIVMETDAPDIPPHWLYVNAEDRAAGLQQGRNSPDQLPRIAAVVAQIRGVTTAQWMEQTTQNACEALPKLKALLSA